ncbi:MAG: toxin-antitoxin system antitoxin subunit [Bacteroidales bacterium]
MNRPEYNDKLKKVIETCNIHRERMLFALGSLEKIFPVDPVNMKNLTPEQISLTDQLIYRFSQLQDTIGNKLFPLIIEGLGEDIQNKPFIDILNRLEKLSITDSADKWLSLREIRNIVTHEYPDNEEEIADGLNQLSREASYLSSLLDKLTEYIKSRKLL